MATKVTIKTKPEPPQDDDAQEVQLSESESDGTPAEATPFEDVPNEELDGLALTARLNQQLADVEVPAEFTDKMGVYNEMAEVRGVPAGMHIVWATPEMHDGGMHLNYLLRDQRYRFVHPREVSKNPNAKGFMFIGARWVPEGDRVTLQGSTLLITLKEMERKSRARQSAYGESMIQVRQDQLIDLSEELRDVDRNAQVSVDHTRRQVKVGGYNPVEGG